MDNKEIRIKQIKETKRIIGFRSFANVCKTCVYNISDICSRHKVHFPVRGMSNCRDHDRKPFTMGKN